ncbi:hypothetical protein CJF31_00007432 [Rutstroemia sp. NJR-2017a BVV2]|nr:hypothetical protein CJF31_00007432 [Rutstroemia sp. NJR-2017a BVV2]
MDFWQRLIAGTSLAPAGSKATANNPEKRLTRFKREYNHLLQLWQGASNLARDYEAAEQIRTCLLEITRVLSDESRRPLPHPCIAFAASQQIYISIGKIATTSYNEGIIREAVALFAALLDSEEENFVENDTFSKSLMNLLTRITGTNSISLGSETVVDVVELSFNITTKIRLDPEILPVWFTTQHRDEEAGKNYADAHEKFAGKTHKEDFPLFYLLIDYIHEEGRCGDFARTGLLYIIEAASNDVNLEQWIVESDLATLMATGLGALYSQLSRKLVIDHLPDALPPILALSDYEHPRTTHEIVSSVDEDYQSQMETFLSHLVFWQDVLNHCKSVEVKQTLLEHFQVIFLQQLLYPSLLESSDVDGGSSVAVLTYLRRILEALDHPDMIHLILHYLLALPDTTPAPSGSRASVSAARKRKSLDLATMMAMQVEMPSTPALYNLVDLIQGSLRSESQQTITVTLQLVSVILKRHHRYAVTTLLRTGHVLGDGPQRTIGAHEKEVEYFLTLAEDLGGDDNFDEVYENHIRDSMNTLESHACSIPLIAPKPSPGQARFPGSQGSIPGAPRDIRPHTLRPEDPVLKTLLDILSTFFTNTVETNLALTATIVDLATCGYMSVDGWLLPDPSKYVYEEDEEGRQEEIVEDILFANIGDSMDIQEKAQIRALKLTQRCIKWSATPQPEILIQLQTLADQVATYRAEIPRFDDILQQRREAFQQAASMTTPVRHRPDRQRDRSTHNDSPPRQSTLDRVAQRIFPDFGTPTRSQSPRGRSNREQRSTSGSHGFSTPTNNRGMLPPPQFPIDARSPSRGSSRSSAFNDQEESMKGRGVPASQAAAFAAIDQGILNRRVGIPPPKTRTIAAIPFPDLNNISDASTAGNVDSADGVGESKTVQPEQNVELSSTASTIAEPVEEEEEEEKKVSVSHVLTNVIVLQEFLLELAALVQVRAGLFGEVKFI